MPLCTTGLERDLVNMDSRNYKFTLIALLVITLVLAFYVINNFISENKNIVDVSQKTLQTLTDDKNNVEFQITPLSPSEFQIAINTHSVDLDFDLTEISTLYDDAGNAYKPLKWDGSEPDGHHRNGILKFSSINSNAKSIKLVITDTATREFNWNLR